MDKIKLHTETHVPHYQGGFYFDMTTLAHIDFHIKKTEAKQKSTFTMP